MGYHIGSQVGSRPCPDILNWDINLCNVKYSSDRKVKLLRRVHGFKTSSSLNSNRTVHFAWF